MTGGLSANGNGFGPVHDERKRCLDRPFRTRHHRAGSRISTRHHNLKHAANGSGRDVQDGALPCAGCVHDTPADDRTRRWWLVQTLLNISPRAEGGEPVQWLDSGLDRHHNPREESGNPHETVHQKFWRSREATLKTDAHLIVRSSSVACAVALALATLHQAQAIPAPALPVGGPITVSAPSDQDRQDSPALALDATGGFVVVWQSASLATPGGPYDIYARRYAADGMPEGSAFQVNTSTPVTVPNPSVAMDAAGDFVVTWQGYNQSVGTSDIYAQRYASNGTPLGSNFLVGASTSAVLNEPSVAMDATGDFVVAWDDYDETPPSIHFAVYAERFSSNGASLGSAFRVGTSTSTNQYHPSVAMDAAGDFVVAWLDYGQFMFEFDIHAERYASNGAPLGSTFQVAASTSIDQYHPSVAMDAAGDFVVAWESTGLIPSTSGSDIDAERYASNGTPLGSNFRASPAALQYPFTSSSFAEPVVAMDQVGDFVVAWGQYDFTATYPSSVYFGIGVQRYLAEGTSTTDVSVTGLSSEATVTPREPFSVSFEVVNQTAPSPGTTDAYLPSFVGGWISDPTITVTLGQVATIPAGGLDWTCTGSQTATFICTYAGVVGVGQSSPPLIVDLLAPSTPGAVAYGATVAGSSEPPFTGSVTVANPSGGKSGGGGFGGIELLGLSIPGLRRRFARKTAV